MSNRVASTTVLLCLLACRVGSRDGDVDLDLSTASAAPDVKAETFSGDIAAKLPDVSNGHLRFNSFSGDFRSDFPVMLKSRSKRDISADIGSGGGANLEFKTFSGDLKLVK